MRVPPRQKDGGARREGRAAASLYSSNCKMRSVMEGDSRDGGFQICHHKSRGILKYRIRKLLQVRLGIEPPT